MAAPAVVERGAKLGWAVTGALAFLPPLLTRLVLGPIFYATGRGKLEHIDKIVQFFTDLGIPMPALNAAFVSRLEFYGGIALVVGLATRFAAAGLASTMVVALMTADKEDFVNALHGVDGKDVTGVVPFVYLVFLLWLVIAGPGVVSLDALVARWVKKNDAPNESASRTAEA